MAQFDSGKISVLFSLCLVRAKAKRIASEYDALSHAINSQGIGTSPFITKKYLDESIDKKLVQAKKDNKPQIGLNHEYVEALVRYLGLKSYKSFEELYSQAKNSLKAQPEARIRIYYEPGKDHKPKRIIDSLRYPEQSNQIDISLIEAPARLEALPGKSDVSISLLHVSQSWFDSQSTNINSEKSLDELWLIEQGNQTANLKPLSKELFLYCYQILANPQIIKPNRIDEVRPIDFSSHLRAPGFSKRAISITSLILFGLVLVFSFIAPCLSYYQQVTIRITSAISLMGVSLIMPAVFHLKNSKPAKYGMALTALVVVFILDPVNKVHHNSCGSLMHLTGTVWLGDDLVAGATVRSPELQEIDQTNVNGTFDLPFNIDLVNQSINIEVNYRGIVKLIKVDKLSANLNLPIFLADTLMPLNDSLALERVYDHINNRERKIRNEADRLIRVKRGQKISSELLLQKLTVWQQLGGRVRNEISFSNGFWRLNTQRAISNTGLISLPLDFSSSWQFQKPTIYLLDWQYGIQGNQDHSTVLLEYVILENETVQARAVSRLRQKARTQGSVRINHSLPLRMAHVTLEYSKATGWFKESKTKLLGYLPNEQYLLEYYDAQWHISNTRQPGKNS